MSRSLVCLPILALLFTAASATPSPVSKGKLKKQIVEELQQLEAMWVVASVQKGRERFSFPEDCPDMILTISKKSYRFEIRSGGDAYPGYDVSTYRFAIDPTSNPKRLWTTKKVSEVPMEGETTIPEEYGWFPRCGYEVTGDLLRVVVGLGKRNVFPDSFH